MVLMKTDLMTMGTKQLLMHNFFQFPGNMLKTYFFYHRFPVLRGSLTLLLLLMGLSGCQNVNLSSMNAIGANITPIRDITPKQNNSTVYIQGKIEKHIPLLSKHAYKLNDTTGSIVVLTNQSGLKVGSQIVIKGQLRYKSIPLGGQEKGEVYLEEK